MKLPPLLRSILYPYWALCQCWCDGDRYVNRKQQCLRHQVHIRQLLADWQAGKLTDACLNNLCQSAWSARHPRWPFEHVQTYLRRQVRGGRQLQQMVERTATNPGPHPRLRRYGLTGVAHYYLLEKGKTHAGETAA